MKARSFSLLLVLFGSLQAVAGSAWQDEVVASLEKDFAASATPSEADLRLGKPWLCRKFSARENQYNELRLLFALKKHPQQA